MKNKMAIQTESHIDRSNKTKYAFGFSHPRTQKLRRATVMFGAAVGGLLLVTPGRNQLSEVSDRRFLGRYRYHPFPGLEKISPTADPKERDQ